MREPLLKTKFHLPSIRSGIVSRSRLLACLKGSLDDGNRLTLVSAPAGFGKSTLLSEFARTCEQPVAWLSLDETEAQDAVRFWTYILSALQSVIPELGGVALVMLQASPPAEMTTVLTSLINEMTVQATSILLVLDDYQFIHAQAIHEAVSFLIEHAPSQLHLVLATRIDPPLNLARLRIRGQMVEVRADDLRFAQQEVATFLNETMNLDLSSTDVDALEARTEGWIAGLQVAAMAMRDRADVAGFIAAFTGSHRHILSYLIEEVFTQQPEAVQRFLLKTSVLDRLCGALCDALTGRNDGQVMLERLERENVFVVPLDDEQCWYRYHHLFRDVLRAHLQRTYAPEDIAALHRQASGWHEHSGDIPQAIQHALQIDDFSRVAALLKDSAMDMIGAYSLTTLQGWLDALPDTL